MNLTPNKVKDAPPAGASAEAAVHRAGDWLAAVWVDFSKAPFPHRVIAEGPGGRGEAWIRTDPTTIGLQIADMPARIGPREVTIRRNRWRLRRANRVVTIRGAGTNWELRPAEGHTSYIVEVPTGREIWRIHEDGTRSADDNLTPDQVAALLLFDDVDLRGRLGPNLMRYV